MERLIRVLRSDSPPSDADAHEMFSLLIPIIEMDPTDGEAVETARAVIARCVPRDDNPLPHVLDWWFVTTTGQSSANGGAYRLPASIDETVRVQMEAVMAIAAGEGLPAAHWLYKKRQFDLGLGEIGDILRLDHYGPSKLPGERKAWDWLLEQFNSAVVALRANQKALRVDIADRQIRQQLRDGGVQQGSHRWREMEKRCNEATARLNALIDLQHAVQPWIRRLVPHAPFEAVPDTVASALGPLSGALLRPILAPNAAPDVNRDELARRLDDAAGATNDSGRYRLARIVDSWCQHTGCEIPTLVDVLDRHRRVDEGRRALADNNDIDLAGVQRRIAADDLDAAEAELAAMRTEVERLDGVKRTQDHFEGLRRRVLGADLGDDSEWLRRLDDIAGRVEDSDPQDLAREIDDAQRQLAGQLNELRRGQLDQLRNLLARLEQLEAPSSVLFDWRKETRALEAQPAGPAGRELILELEEEIERTRRERRESVKRRVSEVDKALADDRGDFTGADLDDLVKRQSEIEALVGEDEIGDSELVSTGTAAEVLLRDLEKRRIHRWSAAEGESVLVEHLVEYCTSSLDFDNEDIRRLHVALKTKPFVILAGLTGSGKSSLTRLYAEAVGANSANGQFRRVAVRPDWIDQSEVLGFVNPISQRFVPGWLAETIRRCERSRDRLHFVLLDEMNLAPVEQYLAELLSAMEEARSGGDDVRLPLYSRGEEPVNADEWPPDLSYPDNLIIVGTVNVDETTRPLSERVIDRANVLHLSVRVSERHHSPNARSEKPWHVSVAEWRKVCVDKPSSDHHEFLIDVADILRGANIGVGLRAHLELERFMANAERVIESVPALDWGHRAAHHSEDQGLQEFVDRHS